MINGNQNEDSKISTNPSISHEHKLDLSEMKENAISESSQRKLNNIIEQVPLKNDEFSSMGLTVKINEFNDIVVTILIRNGTKEDIQLKQLPLILYDAKGDIGAKGTFKLKDLTIYANTSKPITVVFPKSSILKNGIDLAEWSLQHG